MPFVLLSNWTISSLVIKDLSTTGAPRFGTCTKVLSLLYSVTLLTVPD
nr:MAG TPA: hypothetical protein [Caudoviricetes sp.]